MTLGVDTDLIKVACYAGLSSHPIFVGPTYLKTGSWRRFKCPGCPYLQWQWRALGSGSAAVDPPPAPAAHRWSRCSDGRTRTSGSQIWSPLSSLGAADNSCLQCDLFQRNPICNYLKSVCRWFRDTDVLQTQDWDQMSTWGLRSTLKDFG